MTRVGTCERLWQAEAIEDGRLDGSDRLSFEKHARACVICAKELGALARLRETMQRIPALSSTPFEHRRRRVDLLRQANGRAVNRNGNALVRRWIWLAAALSIGVVAVVLRPLLGHVPSATESGLGPPSFEVDDVDGAVWSSEVVGQAIHARLSDGAASFHVEHTRVGQRFLLQMPDAQVEVHGTRFRVKVRAGATHRVEVSEGIVALRLRGEPERLLRAGETWDAVAPGEPLSLDTAGIANAIPLENQDASASSDRSGARSAPDSRSTGAQHDAFSAAVAAFRSANYRKAEQMLDRFLEESPRDARIEDAWFMKAVARSRTGDTDGAAQLARAYLLRFPNGLRRLEAEKIAASSSKR
jgi:hypothetical protein